MSTAQEKFKELQEKSKKIIQGAIQINTKIEAARENHQRLAQIAQEKYSTSNVDELKSLLKDWEEENASQLEKYELAVTSLEKEVNEKSALINSIKQSAN